MRVSTRTAARSKLRPSFLLLLFLLVCAEAPVKAYADPGSGLLFWQILVAVFFGAIYQGRKALSRIWKKK
jgi:hypothetical protein